MNCHRLLGTALCTILLSSTAATDVLGQNDPATQSAMTGNGEGSLSSSLETVVEPSPGAGFADLGFNQPGYRHQWTATAEFIILDRIGSASYPLVSTVPASQSLSDPGTEVLNARDLHQGFSSGPRLDLIHHGGQGADLEVVYFQIDGWNAARSTGLDPNHWLVMKAPGGFVQGQDDKDTQMMVWDCSSRFYNAEVNARWNLWRRVTVLAGFRWVNLSEDLQGTLPPQRTVPFWDTQTKNNLYGFQIGAEGNLFERGRFSIGCTGKAGVFDNRAEETTTVSIYRLLFGEFDSTDHVAFVGEVGVRCKCQVTQQLSLRAGYEAIWLQRVALAPGQIPETVAHGSHLPQEIYLQPLGVNCGSGVFYHGATAGLEYSF
ncbi:MAG: hypothetical protein ACYC3X_26815 [Pirellulaceae bacterium]